MSYKPLNRHVQLNSAKSVTVQAVGEFAYKDTLARTPEGFFLAQLVPEPDNPHDPNAISVRYNGDVIAYIPADRTSKYWQAVAKVIVSGAIPTVKARHYVSKSDYHEIKLFLLGNKNALPAEYSDAPSVDISEVPPNYKKRTPVNRPYRFPDTTPRTPADPNGKVSNWLPTHEPDRRSGTTKGTRHEPEEDRKSWEDNPMSGIVFGAVLIVIISLLLFMT